ncbi:MAG: hypothetical protein IPN69_25035 [Acidobacteria bacterium]|nr:hypothetical protein [Acidobacteriota bacterium]MBK8147487.1 hypothetical protein [Acidobacteriota bacterium]MBK8813975.1 hypothetical protein [Acidobacteriota bacterium]
MKIKTLFAVLCVVSALTISVSAQRKKTTPTPTKKPAVTVTNALEIKQSAEKVATQLKNVTSFIYKLGGIATGLEDAEKEARAGKLSKAAVDRNNDFKQAVVISIRNLKAGLAALEIEFRTKNSIKPYLAQINGVTDLATQSEDLASAGQFTNSGRSLILVIEKLADTLVAMP